MNIDSIWTRAYKGHWIHGHADRDTGESPVFWLNADTRNSTRVVSYRAAQLAITKYVKERQQCES